MSQQNDDFISFEKALRDLQLQSEQLKKLVSEGEIRAFRDGDSMKFKKEDLEALRDDEDGGEDELVFADALEDDTGMVTEELSEEDTLLADDEDEVEDEPVAAAPARAARPAPAARSGRSRVEVEEDDGKEPVWATACILLGFVVLLYGLMIVYTLASGGEPSGMTSPFAPEGS